MTKIAFIGDIHGKNATPLGRLCSYNDDLFDKLKFIRGYCEQNAIKTVIHLGDIYDKPEATDAWKNKFIQCWKDFNGNFYSIIGKAHDLFFNNEQSFSKTCLYNLELSGVLKVLIEPIQIGDVAIYPLSMHINEAKKQLKSLDKNFKIGMENILLAHQFYDWELDLDAGFTREELSKLLTNTSLILGHDHRQHDTEVAGLCQIFRPGSLMRTELSDTMIHQKPRILVYDNHNWSYIEVPHRPITEIYDVTGYRFKKTNSKLFRNLHNNLNDISKYLHTNTKAVLCSKALKDLNCPSDEFEYLKSVHQLCNQEF